MNENPDEIYRAKAAMDPVAPVTLRLYPELRLVKGPMQRSVLANAKRKASVPWLSGLLMLAIVSGQALLIWSHQNGRDELAVGVERGLLVIFLSGILWLIIHYVRTRAKLRADKHSECSAGADG
jgi:hypothetical protein